MKQLRKVSKVEKVVFPVFVVLFCSLLLPSVAPLLGMLMLGNLFRESGVVERLSDTAQNALCNIVTIMLGTTVGATADGEIFLRPQTIAIIVMGLIAFCFSTVGGVLLGKLLCHLTGGKINRFRRRICRSDGSPRFPDSRFQREPDKLPVNARYGTKRSRRYRIRSCSWFLHADLRLGSSIRKMTFRTAGSLRVGLGGYLYKR